MSASEVIKVALSVGITIQLDGDDLLLNVTHQQPPMVLAMVSPNKATVVEYLLWQKDMKTILTRQNPGGLGMQFGRILSLTSKN